MQKGAEKSRENKIQLSLLGHRWNLNSDTLIIDLVKIHSYFTLLETGSEKPVAKEYEWKEQLKNENVFKGYKVSRKENLYRTLKLLVDYSLCLEELNKPEVNKLITNKADSNMEKENPETVDRKAEIGKDRGKLKNIPKNSSKNGLFRTTLENFILHFTFREPNIVGSCYCLKLQNLKSLFK